MEGGERRERDGRGRGRARLEGGRMDVTARQSSSSYALAT